jgi:hypothetical protein
MVPPSMTYSAPLMALARSETRNATSFGGLGGLRGPADRDAAEEVHDLLQRRILVDACAAGDAVDQSVGALGLNESGGGLPSWSGIVYSGELIRG